MRVMVRPGGDALKLMVMVMVFAALLAGAVIRAQPATPSASSSAAVIAGLDARRAHFGEVALAIWNFAEVGYQEERSSALLQRQLTSAGFAVTAGVAEMPTSFVATYGSGAPVIGILAEFDALPGLSQAATPGRKAIVENGAGHGCGHHLFGTASVAAAAAVKDWLATSGRPGTIKVFGTPAEEGGAGKVYMLRAGLFDAVDAVVSWHPGDRNAVSADSSLANINAKFRSHGVSSHAAVAPERGRSALDGVEAMDAMVNMMREHVPSDTRIHYVITRGGSAPNVVPDFAEVYYYARHHDMRVLDAIWQRIENAAKGAALGTETRVEMEIMGAVWNVVPNTYLASVMERHLKTVGGYTYTPDERAFAEGIRTLFEGTSPPIESASQVMPIEHGVGGASTDTGDVSWRVPTVQMSAATWVPGTSAHSWQAVAAGGTQIGVKGMMVAAKTMALTVIDLLSDPAHVVKAREEFIRVRGGNFTYTTRLATRKPPLDYRK